MRVRVETNKKEAIGVAPFLITFLFQLLCKNWRSYKHYDSTTNHIIKLSAVFLRLFSLYLLQGTAIFIFLIIRSLTDCVNY